MSAKSEMRGKSQLSVHRTRKRRVHKLARRQNKRLTKEE